MDRLTTVLLGVSAAGIWALVDPAGADGAFDIAVLNPTGVEIPTNITA